MTARQITILYLKENLGKSVEEIADFFGTTKFSIYQTIKYVRDRKEVFHNSETDVRTLNISSRAKNALVENGVTELEDLREKIKKDPENWCCTFLRFGKVSKAEVELKLKELELDNH